MSTEVERAYLAGLIDGEGHIGITMTSAARKGERWRKHYLILTVAMTHREVLRWCSDVWEVSPPRIKEHKDGRQAVWTIRWSDAQAARVLADIFPYMKVKVGQAQLALQFAATLGARPHKGAALTEDEWNQRERLRLAISELNRPLGERGTALPFGAKAKEPRYCRECGAEMQYATRKKLYCAPRCQWRANKEKYNEQHKRHQREVRASQSE